MALSKDEIIKIIEDISGTEETQRKELAERRQNIYDDGGQVYLIDSLEQEFGKDAIAEMRLAPVNPFKKIVNTISAVYDSEPVRRTELPKDQEIVDAYVKEQQLDSVVFPKLNKYYNAFANAPIMIAPKDELPMPMVLPGWKYSVVTDPKDPMAASTYILSIIPKRGDVKKSTRQLSATGHNSVSVNNADKDVDESKENEFHIFWTDEEHFMVNGNAVKQEDDPANEKEGNNPIGVLPFVNITRERESFWSTQGEDAIQITMLIQKAWTDVFTVVKEQGYGKLIITSAVKPEMMTFGTNKAAWLQTKEGQPTPTAEYLTSGAPITETKELILDLQKQLLITYDISPATMSGDAMMASSGFQQLLLMSDTLKSVKRQQPTFSSMERQYWKIKARWHNWMLDNKLLRKDFAAMGKMSEDIEVGLTYRNPMAIESTTEIINEIKELSDIGMITEIEKVKKLHPSMTDEEAEAHLLLLKEEKEARMKDMQKAMGGATPFGEKKDDEEEDKDEKKENPFDKDE